MRYRLDYRFYQRPFRAPLQTAYGLWSVREGIILRLQDEDGRIGWGEIAPLHWFGSESVQDAVTFCQQLPSHLTIDHVLTVPSNLPACQFGLEAAWEDLQHSAVRAPIKLQASAVLLPTGAAALSHAYPQAEIYKWKIGVAPIAAEIEVLTQLLQRLPAEAKLRLDANGGLTEADAHQWLEWCDRRNATSAKIEFLEQPCPPGQVNKMLELSRQYATPIALDESVANLQQLKVCYDQGWRGIFVIKAAIAGSPLQLRDFCQSRQLDVVWSSVFETAIAQRFIQRYLVQPLHTKHVLGFGTSAWFDDAAQGNLDSEQLWQIL